MGTNGYGWVGRGWVRMGTNGYRWVRVGRARGYVWVRVGTGVKLAATIWYKWVPGGYV